jgi:hypothetical protein
LVTALGSPVPAADPSASSPTSSPSPVWTLAPIAVGSQPEPAASSASGQPKVLGHVYASAYCTNFVERFNVAATTIVSNDQDLTSVDTTLRRIEDDYDRIDGAGRVYDDRVKLIDEVSQLMKSIPVTQAAVNDLLAQAKATTDPDRKAALQESASELQRTVDRQKAMADDLNGVVNVLMDKHKAEDTAEYNIQNLLLPGMQAGHVSLLDDPVPEAGEGSNLKWSPSPSPSPGATPKPGSVEDVLQWTRQRSIIANAESHAAAAADHVVTICDQERPPTAPPVAPPTSTP